MTELIEPINEFFESVRVMAEDDRVRDNRLNLLEQLRSSIAVLGDLSQIVIE
ncbi:MAG: DALR anticodon-binding domain-containing protein [Bacillota bacterium]